MAKFFAANPTRGACGTDFIDMGRIVASRFFECGGSSPGLWSAGTCHRFP